MNLESWMARNLDFGDDFVMCVLKVFQGGFKGEFQVWG